MRQSSTTSKGQVDDDPIRRYDRSDDGDPTPFHLEKRSNGGDLTSTFRQGDRSGGGDRRDIHPGIIVGYGGNDRGPEKKPEEEEEFGIWKG